MDLDLDWIRLDRIGFGLGLSRVGLRVCLLGWNWIGLSGLGLIGLDWIVLHSDLDCIELGWIGFGHRIWNWIAPDLVGLSLVWL